MALCRQRFSFESISTRIGEDIVVTPRTLQRLERKYKDHGTILDLPQRKWSKKLLPEMMAFINNKLEEDDELTAPRLKNMLLERWPEL